MTHVNARREKIVRLSSAGPNVTCS